jgi:hypothetical protein
LEEKRAGERRLVRKKGKIEKRFIRSGNMKEAVKMHVHHIAYQDKVW